MQQGNNKLVLWLLLAVIGMFGFGFALVPLYDVLCDLTGINGKTNDAPAEVREMTLDTTREVTVEFITRNARGMGWRFEPKVRRIKVTPGEVNEVIFHAQNTSGEDMIGQAVPSTSPGTAALYLNKTECFCFNQQPLKAGEAVDMPMRFYVDPELPRDIQVFTLSYTLYDVTSKNT